MVGGTFVATGFALSVGWVVAGVVAITLLFTSLLTIFLLIRAPRGGVWVGLALQVVMLLVAIVFVFMSSPAVLFAVPIALATALALAFAWPKPVP